MEHPPRSSAYRAETGCGAHVECGGTSMRQISMPATARQGRVSATTGGKIRLCRTPRRARLRLASSRRCCGTATGFCYVTDLPGVVGIPTSGTCPVGTRSPGNCLAGHLLESFERSWASTSRRHVRPTGSAPADDRRGPVIRAERLFARPTAARARSIESCQTESSCIVLFGSTARESARSCHDRFRGRLARIRLAWRGIVGRGASVTSYPSHHTIVL
jgi:hypothetical protein